MVNLSLRFLFGLLLALGGCAAAQAQWQTKPFQQWTANEAEALLSNSAWAETRSGLLKVDGSDPSRAIADSTVIIRLYSALPLRQALARLKQLKNKYDKKSDSEKAAIEARIKPLLECPECVDNYVVAIRPGPDSRNELPMSERLTLANLKRNVHIKNEKGETRELVKFVLPRFNNGDAMLFFSRLNAKGEPLITPGNRTVTIWFDHIFGWAPATITKFEFDVARMTFKGKVVF
jgi:hypothetical protein